MSMMGNRVQCCSYEVGSVIVTSYIGKRKGLADEMFPYEIVRNLDVLSSRIVDRVLSNVHA